MKEQTAQDEVLGILTWDDSLEWWEGKREIMPGHTISVSVSPNDVPLETVVELARRAYRQVQTEEPSLRRAAADALLTLHNEEWNEGEPIGSATFISRMVLTEFSAYDDGSAEISYDDGGLFLGHTIIVFVDADGTIKDASING